MRDYKLNLKRLRKHAYIDLKTITIPKGFFEDLNVPKLYDWLYSFVVEELQEVKHGKWEIYHYPRVDAYQCSVCKSNWGIDKFQFYIADKTDSLPYYCPNCGAKMDGKENKK